jgi:hypothetical protein
VNVTELTTAAGWIAGLAILALIASGWRKPARATADPARDPAELVEQKMPLAENTPLWRRLRAVVASSVLAVWIAAIAATAIAFGAAWLVITLTDMLKK